MNKLFTERKYRTYTIFNIAGIVLVAAGWFLNELYLKGRIIAGGSWTIIVGGLFWLYGETGILRQLLKE